MSPELVSKRFWTIPVIEKILESLDEPRSQQSELWLGDNQTQTAKKVASTAWKMTLICFWFTNIRESNININTSNVFPWFLPGIMYLISISESFG